MRSAALPITCRVSPIRPKASVERREGADAGLCFISSLVFAVGVSTYTTMRRLHPEAGSAVPNVVLLAGFGIATFVASVRVVAGMHFITDALGGTIIGSPMVF